MRFEGSSQVGPTVILFHRDLRVNDHPALATAVETAAEVVPLFVLDPAILNTSFATPNRVGFLLECLHDLRRSLQERGGNLVVRSGDPVEEALKVAQEVAARAIFTSADVGWYPQRRQDRMAEACGAIGVEYRTFSGVTVVPPGEVTPTGGGPYRVFTPYWRAWHARRWRPLEAAPSRVDVPAGLAVGHLPALDRLVAGDRSPRLAQGGESVGRDRFRTWTRSSLDLYEDRRDDLAVDDTSRLSPYLHFGCLSPLEVVSEAAGRPGGEAFIRQMCWRDFHHQVTAAHPRISTVEYRPRGDRWRGEGDELEAWRRGETGYPIIDAGMRQLRAEGWMHNRARMITASFLTKHLYVDWRKGADWFMRWLVDGDIVNNSANWQWVAGTGNDTRPNRILNPLRQADRYDPDGAYVRRWVPELAHLEGRSIHRPWEHRDTLFAGVDYPDRLVDLDEASAAFRAKRG